MCSGIAEINVKRKDLEQLKIQLLEEELKFKQKLFELQLQAATKEVEMKTEILRQVKGMCMVIIKIY